jgi:hypothetical protein
VRVIALTMMMIRPVPAPIVRTHAHATRIISSIHPPQLVYFFLAITLLESGMDLAPLSART